MANFVPEADIYDRLDLDDSFSEADDGWTSESDQEGQEDLDEPPFTGVLNRSQSVTEAGGSGHASSSTDGNVIMSYGDDDSGPVAPIPPFRPENPPGLMLPDDRTRKDFDDYLTPGSFFKLFFTTQLMTMICEFTNTYKEQQATNKPSLAKNWTPLTPDELYCFFALLMYMSLVQVSRIELYWSTKVLYHGLWGRAFMYHMLDVARVNSFIMFQEFRKLPKNANRPELERPNSYSQIDFTIELIKELAHLDNNMPVPLYEKKVLPVEAHAVVPVPCEHRGNCYRCYRLKKIERKSNFQCKKCNRHFCFNKNRNCLLMDHPLTEEL